MRNGVEASLLNGGSQGRELLPYERPAPFVDPQTVTAQIDYSQRQQSLAHYWHVLIKRRWSVITVVFVLTTLAVIASYKAVPIFRASSSVQVEAETPLIQSLNDLYHGMGINTDDAFLQTQLQVVQSDTLAWHTIEQLGMAENPAFANPSAMAKLDPEARKVRLIALFKSALNVELIPKTRMILVGFDSRDPVLAARVANTLVTNYVDYNFQLKYDATRQASGWMETQLDELKAKVEKSQQALVDYERQHSLNSVGSGAQDRENVEDQVLSDLSKDLTTAQAERIEKESLYNQVQADRAQIARLAHNDLLQRLEEKLSEEKQEYTEALAQYGPKYPRALRFQKQIDETQSQIGQEQDRVIDRIRLDYGTAVNRENLARAAVAREKEVLGGVNQLLVQHNILQRDFDANEQLYQNLIQRLKDATVSAGLRSTNVHQVDVALPPDRPIRPRKLLNISVATLAGLMLGIMLAFGQEALDHSIRSAEEIEALLAIPTLGTIPLHRLPRASRAYKALGGKSKSSGSSSREVALAVAERPSSVIAEAYRALRTSVLLSLADHPPKTLLITSAAAGDGKTVTSVNLAMAMAQRKGPVLLVDADLRKTAISRIFNCDTQKGLTSVLAGVNRVDEVLHQYDAVPNLWILPAGPASPSPADLLSSDSMIELLQKLSERFEHVIIDTPPVMAVTDATILSPMVDGVVLVAQGARTSKALLLRTCRILESAGARILGFALNKFDYRDGYYGYYYGYNTYGYYNQSKSRLSDSSEVA